MKRLAKTPMFLIAISSLLTACSQKSIAGTYGFQLGKEKGTHFGIYLKLSDKKFVDEQHPEISSKAKKCSFSFSAKLGEDDSEIATLLEGIKALLNQEGKDRVTIPGYYYANGKVSKKAATEIKLGIDFNFFNDVISDLTDDEESPLPDIDFPVLDPDKIELIVYTTYSNNTVTLNIPVSMPDVVYQLYWYGIDFSYQDEKLEIIDSPFAGGVNKPGSHPTDKIAPPDIINTINTEYHYEENHRFFKEEFNIDVGAYRDYYTLAMGLVKN